MKLSKNFNKQIILNLSLNIFATFLPVLILQIFVLPSVSKVTNSEYYGEVILLISIISLIAAPLGNSLNNSKLIKTRELNYETKVNTYNYLSLISSIIFSFITVFVMALFQPNIQMLDYINLFFISLLIIYNSFISVEFRIKLDYKSILISEVILSVGYIVGYVVFMQTLNWIYIYLIGNILMFIYLLWKTKYLKRKIEKPLYLKEITLHTSIILISSLFLSTTSYIDKLILQQFMGNHSVSIYYSVSLIPKMILMAIGPFTSLMLSYLVRMGKLSNIMFIRIMIISLIIAIGGYFGLQIFTPIILNILYPEYYLEASSYIGVVSINTAIMLVSSFINPVILSTRKANWQIVVNGIYVVVYLVLTIIMLVKFGLIGMIIGIITANIVRVLLLVLVFYLSKEREEIYENVITE